MVTLIRYANRKVYNPNLGVRRYIVSDDIVAMLLDGTQVRVLANSSRKDVTNTTLLNMGASLARRGLVENARMLTRYAEAYNAL